MSVTSLDIPLFEGGLRSTHFFNGRIISREDMQREQEAERTIHERLGRAVGDGIVRGLEVRAGSIGGSSVTDPVVVVQPGLALNRQGQTLALDREVEVSLLKKQPSSSTPTVLAGGFAACNPPENNVYVTGTGVYLLAAAPAHSKQGLAQVSGLGNAGASCNAKEVVEGVVFRLFTVKGLTSQELNDEARLRNIAAYKFFLADAAVLDAVRDPFGVTKPASALTDPPLTDCDVPLALLNWTATGGLRWVDLWSVRRSVAPAGPTSDFPFLQARRYASAGAALLQFRDQLRSVPITTSFALAARQIFRWLPPVGLLPLGLAPGNSGFNYLQFFSGLKTRGPMYMEGARVADFVRGALTAPPLDSFSDDVSKGGELLWLYFVRENQQPVPGVPPAVPYLIFARGQLEYQGEPRFNVSHFNYANYSLGVTFKGP
jgi:hypothetical protein